MYLDMPVPPSLTSWVTGVAAYDETSPVPVRRDEAPTGSCTLLVGFGTPLTGHPQAFLAGMHDTSVSTEFAGRQRGVQVDLTPLGVLRLLGRPVDELTGRVEALDALGAPDLAALPERLADRAGWSARGADVAAACGYADHSHLVREFRAIAGCTPSDYVARWRFPDVQDPAAAAS